MNIMESIDVNGQTYKLRIREKTNYRAVMIYTNYQYILEDKRYVQEPSFIQKLAGMKRRPLPPRDVHVGEALSDAVAKWENMQERTAELREEVRSGINVTKEVLEDDI